MGCDDRLMYLISEITYLDALNSAGSIDEMAVCSHVSALGRQLEFTEPAGQTMENPFASSGMLRHDILTKNMTAIFRIATRIYLCSLARASTAARPVKLEGSASPQPNNGAEWGSPEAKRPQIH